MAKNDAETQAEEDAMTTGMASEAMADNEEWETVSTGLGREWDFNAGGAMIGVYLGSQSVDIPKEKQQTGPDGKLRETATGYQFALVDGSNEQVFLWESHELSSALSEVGEGEKIRVSFLGFEQFKGKDDSPRQVKRYQVQRAKSA
jgi:hypothetical protein